MRAYKVILLVVWVVYACGEKLIEKPENLIPREKMILILKDMAIVNAAKGANLGILKDNAVEPTSYIFDKYEIDSIQFVDSDRYYASLPLEYEAIYTEVEALLEAKRIELEEGKKISDSLKLLESQEKKNSVLDTIKPSAKIKKEDRQ